MRVFGIDPGSAKLGFGVVDCEHGRFNLVDHGVIQANRKGSAPSDSEGRMPFTSPLAMFFRLRPPFWLS